MEQEYFEAMCLRLNGHDLVKCEPFKFRLSSEIVQWKPYMDVYSTGDESTLDIYRSIYRDRDLQLSKLPNTYVNGSYSEEQTQHLQHPEFQNMLKEKYFDTVVRETFPLPIDRENTTIRFEILYGGDIKITYQIVSNTYEALSLMNNEKNIVVYYKNNNGYIKYFEVAAPFLLKVS